MSSSRLATLLVTLLLVSSVLAVPVGTAVAAEDGYVGVPDSNIVEDLPVGENASLEAADLEGSTMASDHASSLQVVVTTPDRASDYTNGTEISGGSSGVALVFQDDSNHAGRKVGVPADAIRKAVGHIPEVVRGIHESGERWTRPVEARNGMLFFEIPKFSSNSVVFDGTYRWNATATNGSTNNYNLSNTDGVDDATVELTGVTNSENETKTWVQQGGNESVNVGGNAEPKNVSLTLVSKSGDVSLSWATGTSDYYWLGSRNGNLFKSELRADGVNGKITGMEFHVDSSVDNPEDNLVDFYIIEEAPDGDYAEGTLVKSDYNPPASFGTYTINFQNWTPSNPNTTVTIAAVTTDDTSSTAGAWKWESGHADTPDGKSASVSPDTGGTTDFGTFTVGESKTKTVSLTENTSSLAFTQTGEFDAQLNWTERTQTEDPGVVLNGHQLNHTGTLADGETVTLNGSADWLQTGDNQVVVEVGDGTLSSDAPTPQVQVDYQHAASDTVLAEYASNGWRESYNVSKIYSSDRQGPTATVDFDKTVHDIRYVETSVNGGTWSSVPEDRWTLKNGTTLVVELDDGDGDGQVDAGDDIALRVAGLKVQVQNGAVTVVDPTVPGDSNLDSEVRIDEKRSGFALDVTGTELGDRLHYTHSESWDQADEYALFDADGSQELRLPNAGAGDTFRVTTVPVEVHPQSGDVSVHVASADGPTFTVVPEGQSSSGDAVEFHYLAATAGDTYQLYSVSKGRPVSKAEATTSGAVLEDNDGGETFRIELEDSGSGSSSNSGGTAGIGGAWQQEAAGASLQEGAVVVGWVALVVLLVAATGRSSVRGRSRWVLVGALGAGSGLLAIEVLRPGAVSGAISGGLEEIVPLAGLAAIGLTGYALVSWLQAREKEAATPETSVTFDLNND